ncbi:MAG: sensor histidine kinase [Gammaproteobacteria bacterium]|nr:sensor histidine kinase [Gammaproteobacteria bacterium]
MKTVKLQKVPAPATPEASAGDLFLPNFCSIRVVFAIVIVAELLAFILVLSSPVGPAGGWDDLSLTSLFIQWVALASAAALCLSRPWLSCLDSRLAVLFSYLIPLAITALTSEAAYWIAYSSTPGQDVWHAQFMIRNVTISSILSAVTLRYFYIQHQWKQNIEAETKARLQALQARIHPHFLFNSMNTIASLTRSQPQIAEEVVEDLADLFRASLADARQRITLKEELELSRRYLHIEKLRLGERLTVAWDLQDLPGDTPIPALTIQPLLENAVYHGIEPLADGGTIRITGSHQSGLIEIAISNPLALHPNIATRRGGHHMALDNIRQRLAAHYGDKGTLTAGQQDGHYQARLVFPAQALV